MSKKQILTGVLTGVAVGAVFGVLFAPAKGTETRKKFARRSSDTIYELKDKFDYLVSKGSRTLKHAEEDVVDAFVKVKEDVIETFSK